MRNPPLPSPPCSKACPLLSSPLFPLSHLPMLLSPLTQGDKASSRATPACSSWAMSGPDSAQDCSGSEQALDQPRSRHREWKPPSTTTAPGWTWPQPCQLKLGRSNSGASLAFRDSGRQGRELASKQGGEEYFYLLGGLKTVPNCCSCSMVCPTQCGGRGEGRKVRSRQFCSASYCSHTLLCTIPDPLLPMFKNEQLKLKNI